LYYSNIVVYLYSDNNNETIEIMSHSEKIQRENLESLKGQLQYTNDCLLNRIDEMEDFEVKEFVNLNQYYKEEIYNLENHIKNVF